MKISAMNVRYWIICWFIWSATGCMPQTVHEWPLYGRSYDNQRYAPMTQITRHNVTKLEVSWEYHSGIADTFQATPIVVEGVMYVSLPFNHVVALDARTGKELWRYRHQQRQGWSMCCGPANRGVAVADGKVLMGTVDARLIALSAQTGQILWDIDVAGQGVRTEQADVLEAALQQQKISGGTGIGINMAPIVYRGQVIIGVTGVGYGMHLDSALPGAPLGAVIGVAGRYGRPGFLAAFKIRDGQKIWQFDTVPSQGWEGRYVTSTPDGIPLHRDVSNERAHAAQFADAWRYGGGSAWSTPAIDRAHNLLFFGTGNPSPQMDDVSRPGDNLYTASLVALEATTGKLVWFYQQVPHDLWGYDVASPPVLFDWKSHDGKTIAAVGQASKTGWFYIHDRLTGQLLLKSQAFVPQHNLFMNPDMKGIRVYPGVFGGANWSPVAVDEQKQRVYIAAMHMPVKYTVHHITRSDRQPGIRYTVSEPMTNEPKWGVLAAIDMTTGQLIWQQRTPQPLIGGVLATAGGLLFVGEGNGAFNAYDTDNGALLWQSHLTAGVNAPPISYQLGGVQYISVAAGGNRLWGYPTGDKLVTYKLKSGD